MDKGQDIFFKIFYIFINSTSIIELNQITKEYKIPQTKKALVQQEPWAFI